MRTASSACVTCAEYRSASEKTATERISRRLSVRKIRQAISPRFATRTLCHITVPNEHLEGGRVVGIARIVELRAVGDEHDDVHLCLHLDVVTWSRETVGEGQTTVRSDRHVHEEIDVVSQIPLPESERIVLRKRQQIAVAAAMHGPFFQVVAN